MANTLKLLVNGSAGMLGSECACVARRLGHEVIALGRPDCNINDPEAVLRAVQRAQPTAVLHCAALTNVDQCEQDPAAAHAINAISAGLFAAAAKSVGACLVYVGSSGIFDGKKTGPYTEDDCPAPLTEYARSKLAGEIRVAQSGCEHLILRAGWLFGGSTTFRKNFVAARWREAQSKSVMFSACDKFGSPTWTRDFATKAIELLVAQARGLYHVVNAGAVTRYDYVSEIVSLFGLPTKVEPVNSSQFARLAPVPDNEALASVRMRAVGVSELRPWRQALSEYVTDLRRTGGIEGHRELADSTPILP